MSVTAHDDDVTAEANAPRTSVPTYADVWVGHRVRLRRLEIGLSLKRLADDMGVSKNQLMKFEGGENRLTCGRLYDIAKSLNTEVGWFFAGMDDAPDLARPASDTLDLLSEPDAVDVVRLFSRLTKPQKAAFRTMLENMCAGNQAIADAARVDEGEVC